MTLPFIPDIGYQDMEELNIITLSDFENPIYFGWPIYEGIKKSSDEFSQYLLDREWKNEFKCICRGIYYTSKIIL